MKGSNYLNWFRRLLVLGAVVAVGALTATGGAQADPSQRHVTVPAWPGKIRYPGPGALAALADAQKPVDPLAVSYLTGRGLSPSEVVSWTSGICSQQNRPDSCYTAFDAAPASSTQVSRSVGFQWADAGIGAGFALGVVLLLAGAGAGFLISRQGQRRQTAHA